MSWQTTARIDDPVAYLKTHLKPEQGLLDRRIYTSEEIYRLELERIFSRAWNFMAHESMFEKPGDYFINYIGEDQVIVVLDRNEEIQVLLNTCTHRGNALCRAEQGNARSFVCTYHGWNFDLDGKLIGIPGEKTYYHDDFNRDEWNLSKAAKVEHYKGFIFATLDENAPPLYDYLGETGRLGMDMLQGYGEVEVIKGVQKNVIDCNWKIAVDNLFDWYHVRYSHRSAEKAGFVPDIDQLIQGENQASVLGDYGHAISGPLIPEEAQAVIESLTEEQRVELGKQAGAKLRPKESKEFLGDWGVRSLGHPNIFPNLWVFSQGPQLSLRLPKGPFETEIWWFSFVPKNATPEERQFYLRSATHAFGPAGLLEQDDGENWSQCSRGSRGTLSSQRDHNLKMGLGHGVITSDRPGMAKIETQVNEHSHRWLYRNYSAWMQSEDWSAIKDNCPAVPTEGKI